MGKRTDHTFSMTGQKRRLQWQRVKVMRSQYWDLARRLRCRWQMWHAIFWNSNTWKWKIEWGCFNKQMPALHCHQHQFLNVKIRQFCSDGFLTTVLVKLLWKFLDKWSDITGDEERWEAARVVFSDIEVIFGRKGRLIRIYCVDRHWWIVPSAHRIFLSKLV